MLIELEHKNSVLHSIQADELKEALTIGRDSECTWRIPRTDTVAGRKHARLYRKGKSIWIEDLGSANGTFLKDKRIRKRKLSVGEQYTLGESALSVSEPRNIVPGRTRSSVTVITGLNRRQKHILEPPLFTIGTDPACHCFLPSGLVSRHHAEIAVHEDGSCWLADKGSKNGTQVNEALLPFGKERLLKDGDRIAISQYELLFQDGALARESSQTWKKVGVLVAAFLVLLLGYSAVQHIKPSASSRVRKSRELARAERFEDARQLLARAESSRGFNKQELNVSMLRRSLGLWEHTANSWQEATRLLEEGSWVQASRLLADLQAASVDSWNWNAESVEHKREAAQAKEILDALLRAQSILRTPDAGLETLQNNRDAVARQLARNQTDQRKYLAPLMAALATARDDLAALLGNNQKLDDALNLLAEGNTPYTKMLAQLNEVRRTESGAVKNRAERAIGPIEALSKSFDNLNAAAGKIRDLDFAGAQKIPLDLPSVEICAIDPRISDARGVLEGRFNTLAATLSQLDGLYQRLAPLALQSGKPPIALRLLSDPDSILHALACDCLDKPMPPRARNSSDSIYDRILGVEEFYAVLEWIPNPTDITRLQMMPFVPAIRQFSGMCGDITLFLSFLNEPQNSWLPYGRLQTYMKSIATVLAERDKLVNQYLMEAAKATGREALIWSGMAYCLSPRPQEVQLDGVSLPDWIASRFKLLRAKLVEMDRQFGTSPPLEQIRLRSEILKTGLPGDPIVRKMWTSRDAAANAKR